MEHNICWKPGCYIHLFQTKTGWHIQLTKDSKEVLRAFPYEYLEGAKAEALRLAKEHWGERETPNGYPTPGPF